MPLSPDHYKFLRFFWKGILHEYLCFAFGLCTAPRVFRKMLKPVVAYLRERGYRLVIYLDYLFILHQSRDGLLSDLKVVIRLLESLGFIIHFKNSVILPQQILEYLVMIVNSFAYLSHCHQKRSNLLLNFAMTSCQTSLVG